MSPLSAANLKNGAYQRGMKTLAFVFCGADSLHDPVRTAQAVRIVECKQRLDQARTHLGLALDGPHDVLGMLGSAFAIQVGLYDYCARHFGTPDFVMGCSMGDLARTYVTGGMDFEGLLEGIKIFAEELQALKGGAMSSVRAPFALTDEDEDAIRRAGLWIAVKQAPSLWLVAGNQHILQKWATETASRAGYRIRPLFPFPLHTPYVGRAKDRLVAALAHRLTNPVGPRIFSSVRGRLLTTRSDLQADIEANLVGTVNWDTSVSRLIDEQGVDHIVNIGPIDTLTRFGALIPTRRPVTYFNPLDSLSGVQNAYAS